MPSTPTRADLAVAVALLAAASSGCSTREGFQDVDHRDFYDLWTTRQPIVVAEGERTAAMRVRGSQADGRDATFTRVDRTFHSADSLTPGCTGELWREGWLVATTPEVFGPDPGDPTFPNGRNAEVGAMRFVVEDALVVRYGCDDPADEVDQEDAPSVISEDPDAVEPVPYSRPGDDAWWVGGKRASLFRIARDQDEVDVTWPL